MLRCLFHQAYRHLSEQNFFDVLAVKVSGSPHSLHMLLCLYDCTDIFSLLQKEEIVFTLRLTLYEIAL